MNPQEEAQRILGPIQWQTPVSGFCHCPGEALHTTKTKPHDCRVNIDGAPTVYCFHASCQAARDAANKALRRALSSNAGWHPAVSPGGTQPADPSALPFGTHADCQSATQPSATRRYVAEQPENPLQQAVRARKARILARNTWSYAEICASTPYDLREMCPEDQFRRFMTLWNPSDIVWIGNVTDSGSVEAESHFRPVSEWLQIGPTMGNFTCPSTFKPGSQRRGDADLLERRYLVVESDTLGKDEVGAVFRWLREVMRLPLHCIVDTAGKSLHGWFCPPPRSVLRSLKIVLAELGCDIKLFTPSQPVRLPGAWRNGKVQQLIWFDDHAPKAIADMRDPGIYFGVGNATLPDPVPVIEFLKTYHPAPPLLVDRTLHQGCKMVLAGSSKSNKTWALMDMALSVAAGAPWWGHATTQRPVLYLNFEVPLWSFRQRLDALCEARPELLPGRDKLTMWNLRSKAGDFSFLRPQLQSCIELGDFGMLILDPAYKLLGDRDENSNSDITSLMNEFDRLAEATDAAIVIAHHFAKGDPGAKFAMDRMSGAGAWARDPDTIMVMTPHEEEDCFTVSSILRCLPRKDDFVVQWDYPLLKLVSDLNPESIRTPQTKQKKCTDKEFIARYISEVPLSPKRIAEMAAQDGISQATIYRYLKRLAKQGLIASANGTYFEKRT